MLLFLVNNTLPVENEQVHELTRIDHKSVPNKCQKFAKIVSVRVTTKVKISFLAMLQFSDYYHVRVIATGDEMAWKSL